jgi:hypothetical protein
LAQLAKRILGFFLDLHMLLAKGQVFVKPDPKPANLPQQLKRLPVKYERRLSQFGMAENHKLGLLDIKNSPMAPAPSQGCLSQSIQLVCGIFQPFACSEMDHVIDET